MIAFFCAMKNFEFIFYNNWIFINIFNIISINCHKISILKELKGIFVSPQCKYSFTTNYAPFMFCGYYGKLLSIVVSDVQWKDKFGTPRHEENPFVSISLFNKFFFNWTWKLPPHIESNFTDNDDYWEQVIWCLYYYTCYNSKGNIDIKKAKKAWLWRGEDDKSTWKDKFLTNKIRNEIYKS